MPNHIATITENNTLTIDGIAINPSVFNEDRCMYYVRDFETHFDHLLDMAYHASTDDQREMTVSRIHTLVKSKDNIVILNTYDNQMFFKSTNPEMWGLACKEILKCHHKLAA